jgi:hypothetical protein
MVELPAKLMIIVDFMAIFITEYAVLYAVYIRVGILLKFLVIYFGVLLTILIWNLFISNITASEFIIHNNIIILPPLGIGNNHINQRQEVVHAG